MQSISFSIILRATFFSSCQDYIYLQVSALEVIKGRAELSLGKEIKAIDVEQD